MADNTINVRIKDRSDTEANWTSKNPVLLKGERAITDGTGKYKIGDGKNTWSALPYYEAMTSADRTKLNGIASGANKTTVDSSLSSSSTNPVQNKVVNSALAGKSNTSHTHDLSTMINTLSIGSSTPTDDDYFVSQYVGGGTTTTTYYRRPVKALLEYIKGKLAKVAISGSYNDLSNKPTIPSVGNGTITIKQAGAVKGSFTTNQSGATTIELTDNNTNTWRDVIDNLTSTATDKSLSAKQGKLLNDNKAEIREWSAQIKCATWSRLCYVEQKGSIIGSSFILNISGTRNSVVYNDTFVIKVHHSQEATISKISGSTYSTGIQVRVVSDSSGNCYVEMYENVNGATNTTTQIVYCSLIDIACGAITTYTSFTNGASIPTGFTSNATITTNSNSLQGNLTWGEITGKPSFKTVATSGSYNDLSNKPTIGNGTVTITQGGTSKGTFTLNQTGNTTIALTDNNSWRGIQNNLTSTSTTDSLSAAQGKVLNDKFASYVPTSRTVNGKALSANISLNASDVGASASGHTHNYVKDAGNSSNTTFAYSKAGMSYGDYAWLAGWNGYELRAVNKNQFAASGHSHDYFSNHTQGEGFEFGFQYSKDINIAKTTAVTTYYVKIVEDGSFRFKNFYVKTYGNNTQYSFKMQAFANAYMQPNAIVNSQVYNEPEIKNVIFAKNPKNTWCHDIYLEIDSATSYDKKISVYADSSLVGTQTTTKPSNIELTVAIRYEDFIYSSKKAYFPKGIDGTASAVPWSGITGKPSTYTPSSHNHDDRYYTESEINSKLNGKANSSHTHNYAGSSSAGGSANSAVKLATARSVSNTEDFVMSFSYDGSANSNASLRYYNSRISVGNTNNYPYHRFAKIDTQTSSYIDKTSTFLITQDYNDGGWGIVRISLRTNNSSSVSTVEAKWLVRCGLDVDCIQIGLYNVFGKTYADAFFKTSGTYTGTVIRNLASGARGNISRTWILTDSAEANSTTTSDKKTSTESYASTSAAATTLHSQAYTSVVVASDGGTVSYANSAGNASKVNNHTVNSDVPANAKFTDTNTTYGVATTSSNGLMSSSDKSKLDGITSGANKYTHPGYTARSNGFYKVTVDGTGHVSGVSSVTKADITNLGIPGSDTNTTYPMYTRTINANYSSQFRSQTKGDTKAGGFIAAIRNNTANVAGSPQYGSGMAWGMADTHGYLYCNYSSAEAYLGAGNNNALNWKKQIAFTDNIPSVGNGTVTIKQGGTSKGSFTMNQSGNTTIELTDNNTTYTLSSITGTLAVSKGGTGSTTAAGGRSNLGAVGFVCQSAEPSGQNNGDLWFKEE